ncbi:MAG: universal stress protein [Burkholderiaceae bacterium]
MYRNILVAVDGSPTSDAGLDEAIGLAKALGARLRLLHLVDQMPLAFAADGFGGMTVDMIGLLRESGQQLLAQAELRVKAAAVEVDSVLVESLNGRLFEHVNAQARDWPADLIVIGTHGRRGVGRMLMGSDAEQVVRHAPVPVLLYRSTEKADADAATQGKAPSA